MLKVLLFIVVVLIFHACGKPDPDHKVEENFIENQERQDIEQDSSHSSLMPLSLDKNRIYYIDTNYDNYTLDQLLRVSFSITSGLEWIERDIDFNSDGDAPFTYRDVTLIIKEGIYSQKETNETFPIIFPEGLMVKGEGTVIIKNEENLTSDKDDDLILFMTDLFGMNYENLIELKNNTLLDSILIEGNLMQGILIRNNTNAIIRNCNVQNSVLGINIQNNANVRIINSHMEGNTKGIKISDNASLDLIGSTITQNDIGIEALHESKLNFIDQNIIKNNTLCSMYDKGYGQNLSLSDQIDWDTNSIHNSCENGVSIATDGSRHMIFQPISITEQLYKNVPLIETRYPIPLSFITTTTPNIKWIPSSDTAETSVAIFKKYPYTYHGKLHNGYDIVWSWDSNKLNNPAHMGILGNINYSDGDGKPLEKGKGYYYVVVEKNQNGQISGSSYKTFFTTDR